MDDLLKQLRATRADYDDESEHHRFLLDTLCGTGGYKGRVGPAPISILGWAADAYSNLTTAQLLSAEQRSTRRSWLNQFAREDDAKFNARIDVSHYVNYTAPILETLLAYLGKEEMNRDKVPPAVLDWMENVDGHGQSWDLLMHEVVRPRAAGLGWCPVLFDRPQVSEGEGEISQARAKELDLTPRAIPLYPINVLDWEVDASGEITAVKIRVCYKKRATLLEPAVTEEVYSLWYADRCERYVVTIRPNEHQPSVGPLLTIPHDYGRVPLVIFRAKPATEDKVRGASIVGDVANANRRIFNLDSELDDFLRNSCFPILGVPVADQATSNVGEIIAGNGSAMGIPHDSRHGLHYVAPPASVSEAIEKRREVLVREVYRAARVEFAKPSGVTTSGIARAYEFEQTNRRLGEIAQSFARGEEEGLTLAAQLLGVSDTGLTVTSPADFSVEDLTSDIANITGAIELGIGATAETELKRRLVRRMLPNTPSETSEAIEAELTEIHVQTEQDDALRREAENALLTAPPEPDEPPDDELN